MGTGAWIGVAVVCLLAGLGAGLWIRRRRQGPPQRAVDWIRRHFAGHPLETLSVTKREFSLGLRVDLQQAIERYIAERATLRHFTGVQSENGVFRLGTDFSTICRDGEGSSAPIVAPQFDEIDIGEAEPVRCPNDCLWLFECDGMPMALFASMIAFGNESPKIQYYVAAPHGEAGQGATRELFDRLARAAKEARSYRGKVLSLEAQSQFTGCGSTIRVHHLRDVRRDDVILPSRTLDLLDRNVVRFVRQRPQLRERGQTTKKGLLLYGPPGTGKTLTIHYLARALENHTTLIIVGDQVNLLNHYLDLARLFQPCLVVLEDVDLIARDRESMGNPCGEMMLNKLLNEMDGLREDAEILFLLTTNRPEALEMALAARPGRIDQAIEFPLPDLEGREKLVRLYGQGLRLTESLVHEIAERTGQVSAAFIKELMRRSLQFQLETDGDGGLQMEHVEAALEELLVTGGSLNLKLLGAPGSAGRVGFRPAAN